MTLNIASVRTEGSQTPKARHFPGHRNWKGDGTPTDSGCSSRNLCETRHLPSPSEPLWIEDVDKACIDNRKHMFGRWARFLVRFEDCNRYSGSFPSILPYSLLLKSRICQPCGSAGDWLESIKECNPVSTIIISELGTAMEWNVKENRWPFPWDHKEYLVLEWRWQINGLYYVYSGKVKRNWSFSIVEAVDGTL